MKDNLKVGGSKVMKKHTKPIIVQGIDRSGKGSIDPESDRSIRTGIDRSGRRPIILAVDLSSRSRYQKLSAFWRDRSGKGSIDPDRDRSIWRSIWISKLTGKTTDRSGLRSIDPTCDRSISKEIDRSRLAHSSCPVLRSFTASVVSSSSFVRLTRFQLQEKLDSQGLMLGCKVT